METGTFGPSIARPAMCLDEKRTELSLSFFGTPARASYMSIPFWFATVTRDPLTASGGTTATHRPINVLDASLCYSPKMETLEDAKGNGVLEGLLSLSFIGSS